MEVLVSTTGVSETDPVEVLPGGGCGRPPRGGGGGGDALRLALIEPLGEVTDSVLVFSVFSSLTLFTDVVDFKVLPNLLPPDVVLLVVPVVVLDFVVDDEELVFQRLALDVPVLPVVPTVGDDDDVVLVDVFVPAVGPHFLATDPVEVEAVLGELEVVVLLVVFALPPPQRLATLPVDFAAEVPSEAPSSFGVSLPPSVGAILFLRCAQAGSVFSAGAILFLRCAQAGSVFSVGAILFLR